MSGATTSTDRLRFEPLVAAHAAALFEVLREPSLYEFMDEARPVDVESLRERYRILERRRSPDGRELWLNWALWSIEQNRYLGYVQATVHLNRSAEVAYVLRRDAWGHGLASEAVAHVIGLLRQKHHVDKVTARVDQRNRRSIALLDRLGFVRVRDADDGDALFTLGAATTRI